MINIYIITAWLTTITASCLGIITYLKNPQRNINKRWLFMNTGIAIWSLFLGFMFNSKDAKSGLIYSRILMIGANLIPVTFYHFILAFLDQDKDKQQRRRLFMGYVVTLGLLLVNFTPLFIKYATYKSLVRCFYPDAGPFFIFYILYYFGLTGYAYFLMYQTAKVSTGQKKNQIKYCLVGSVVGFLGGATTFPLWYQIQIPPFGTHFVWLYTLLVTYAILRYRLLDINIALTRAGIFIVVYALVLGIPFWIGFKYGLWKYSTLIMLVLATSGPLIYNSLRRHAENILRKEQLLYQEELRDISSTMMLIKELERLLRTIVLRVVDIVKVSWAGIYLRDERESKYYIKYQRSGTGEINLPKEFTLDSDLVKHFYKSRLPLAGEEIHSKELKVGLAVPCFIEDNLLGFLLLGDKPKGQLYDQSDVNTFTFLSNQTALAIENCQFYSQERQREHFRRIISLDRQIDCMAHEMDNPIHAVLGVLGSIDIALDELEEVIPNDKMDYLKQKLSRVEFNAKRVSKMISAVKEFTKPTTGEFTIVTLQHIIDSFAAIINPQIHHYGINFTLDLPQEPIWLRANKVEIEQVLVNLGTNSVQAIKEMPKENKKAITLKAYPKDTSTLRIDFSDTGSGIEEKLLEDIFLDFVTTKASSEGTGLGLSISRKIIQRHKGKIWAESEGAGRGASFHIELPIANDITEEDKIKFTDTQNENRKRDMI